MITYKIYENKFQPDFKRLNEEWIKRYFEIEESDLVALNEPQKYILNKGGEIFVALENEKVLGVCAMIKSKIPNYNYELAKMAVSPEAQGKGVGFNLANYAIDWVKAQNANKIFLDSNSILEPAIKLYRKLGFSEIQGIESPYARTNIQMALDLRIDNL